MQNNTAYTIPAVTSLKSTVLIIALVAALAMAPVAPEAGNILYLVAAGAGILMLRPADLATFRRPVVWMPLVGIAMLIIAYGLGSRSLVGALLGLLLFAPMLAIGPLLSLMRTAEIPPPTTLAVLCICGVAGAAAVAVGDYAATGTLRAGDTVANPIHFADVAVAVGFLATLGVVYATGPWRYLFLSGPVLATVAVLLSGTRGALLALAVMFGVSLVLAIGFRLLSRRIMVFGAVALVMLATIALAGGLARTSGIQRLMGDMANFQQAGLAADGSIAQRMAMYEGGFKAFLASPLVGHGPLAYIEAAGSRATVPFQNVPHLHNDIVNFAASGGILGVAGYLFFLLGPLVEALRAPASAMRRGLIVVVAGLTAGYFVMGLTNAMFGILTVTVLFSTIAVSTGLAITADRAGRPSGIRRVSNT